MGQSLTKIYLHITFCTKFREPLIWPPIEQHLHAYIGKTSNELGCQSIIVGGHFDHVHVLCVFSKNILLSEYMQKIKASSSKWMKSKHKSLLHFRWSRGYAAFSVNPKGVERVRTYIQNQHAHHSKEGYKDELRKLLKKYEIEYSEEHLWD